MRSKAVWLLGLLSIVVFAPGCSSEPPKGGVAIQAGDYAHAPGEGAKPNNAATGK